VYLILEAINYYFYYRQALLHLLHLGVDVKVGSAEEEQGLLGLLHLSLGEQEDGGPGHEDEADGHQGRRYDQEAGKCLPADELSNQAREENSKGGHQLLEAGQGSSKTWFYCLDSVGQGRVAKSSKFDSFLVVVRIL